jgi:hypothetical protein
MNIVILRDIIADIPFNVITDVISENPSSSENFRVTTGNDSRITANTDIRVIG